MSKRIDKLTDKQAVAVGVAMTTRKPLDVLQKAMQIIRKHRSNASYAVRSSYRDGRYECADEILSDIRVMLATARKKRKVRK